MSFTALAIPAEYPYVLGTIVLSTFINTWHGLLVGNRRKVAKVAYPTAYASTESAEKSLAVYQFNCAQRAHGQFLESLPNFVISALVAGLEFPKTTAGLGLAWNVGRILFARGYANGKIGNAGKERYQGVFYILAQFGLMLMSGWSVYKMIA